MLEKEYLPSLEPRRPTGIAVLSILYLLAGLFHLLKLSQVILRWPTLIKISLSISPLYLTLQGLVWGISGLVLAWGLRKGKVWSSTAARAGSILFALAFWADRAWIGGGETLAQRWLFNLLLTILGLGSVLLILNKKTSRAYFAKNPAKIP